MQGFGFTFTDAFTEAGFVSRKLVSFRFRFVSVSRFRTLLAETDKHTAFMSATAGPPSNAGGPGAVAGA